MKHTAKKFLNGGEWGDQAVKEVGKVTKKYDLAKK
jgi:hypothetical protein